MKEDFLHYVWKFRKLRSGPLYTSSQEKVEIISTGQYNNNSGPDFFNARVRIGKQLWAGNVEVHLKSSDWYAHHHEKDTAYDNVVLHVVWEDDMPVFRKDNSEIPALELSEIVPEQVYLHYRNLLKGGYRFVNCEKEVGEVNSFLIDHYLERLFFERLEQKAIGVFRDLEQSRNDWEAVFFKCLMKNFGLKVNGEPFLSIASSVDYTVVRKLQDDVFRLEALLFGQSGLLEEAGIPDSYLAELRREYAYLKKKHKLSVQGVLRPQFHKLRPVNFPTLRLSQLANLYANRKTLFAAAMETTDIGDFYKLFACRASVYWDDHYTFGKVSGKRAKTLSKSFIDLLVINTVIPVKFCYARYTGGDANRVILEIMEGIKPEKNGITDSYARIGLTAKNARETQSLLQLYNIYCSRNKCLECSIGHQLLK